MGLVNLLSEWRAQWKSLRYLRSVVLQLLSVGLSLTTRHTTWSSHYFQLWKKDTSLMTISSNAKRQCNRKHWSKKCPFTRAIQFTRNTDTGSRQCISILALFKNKFLLFCFFRRNSQKCSSRSCLLKSDFKVWKWISIWSRSTSTFQWNGCGTSPDCSRNCYELSCLLGITG